MLAHFVCLLQKTFVKKEKKNPFFCARDIDCLQHHACLLDKLKNTADPKTNQFDDCKIMPVSLCNFCSLFLEASVSALSLCRQPQNTRATLHAESDQPAGIRLVHCVGCSFRCLKTVLSDQPYKETSQAKKPHTCICSTFSATVLSAGASRFLRKKFFKVKIFRIGQILN